MDLLVQSSTHEHRMAVKPFSPLCVDYNAYICNNSRKVYHTVDINSLSLCRIVEIQVTRTLWKLHFYLCFTITSTASESKPNLATA